MLANGIDVWSNFFNLNVPHDIAGTMLFPEFERIKKSALFWAHRLTAVGGITLGIGAVFLYASLKSLIAQHTHASTKSKKNDHETVKEIL